MYIVNNYIIISLSFSRFRRYLPHQPLAIHIITWDLEIPVDASIFATRPRGRWRFLERMAAEFDGLAPPAAPSQLPKETTGSSMINKQKLPRKNAPNQKASRNNT